MLLVSHRDIPKILKMKDFLCLKIAEIDMGGHFWVDTRTNLDIKAFFQS